MLDNILERAAVQVAVAEALGAPGAPQNERDARRLGRALIAGLTGYELAVWKMADAIEDAACGVKNAAEKHGARVDFLEVRRMTGWEDSAVAALHLAGFWPRDECGRWWINLPDARTADLAELNLKNAFWNDDELIYDEEDNDETKDAA